MNIEEQSNINKEDSIFVAGHNGMVGSAITRCLHASGYQNLVFANRNELDLTNTNSVNNFFKHNKIDVVFMAAARVGGIHANNTFPADFIYQNLMIQCNIINAAYQAGIDRLLFLGSSCIYPKEAIQPMVETELMNGALEPTNEPYAVAKIAGIKLCESFNRQHETDYRSVMPTNLYGPNDNYHPTNSHVIPGLIRRFDQACKNNESKVTAWGTGKASREFLYVDDMAKACIKVMEVPSSVWKDKVGVQNSHVNIGTGKDCSIRELTNLIAESVGFLGEIEWDLSKPDGAPRKLLDTTLINSFGWKATVGLRDGLDLSVRWYRENC